jgi:hypothetical protein
VKSFVRRARIAAENRIARRGCHPRYRIRFDGSG